MGSREGWPRCDMDTGLDHDPKVLALARRFRDPVRTACALALYQALIRVSWKNDTRVTLSEAAPAWWVTDPDVFLEDLQAVGLLDHEGRLPEHAYTTWTTKARRASAAAAAAAEARWAKVRQEQGTAGDPPSTPSAPAMRPHSASNADAMPYLPTGLPAYEPVAPDVPLADAPARENAPAAGLVGPPALNGDTRPFGEQMAEHGYTPPPRSTVNPETPL